MSKYNYEKYRILYCFSCCVFVRGGDLDTVALAWGFALHYRFGCKACMGLGASIGACKRHMGAVFST